MALSTSDQAQFLLQRNVAADRRRGAMSPDAEATAIFESIALNLLLKPRAALFFALLARNGLLNATNTEIAGIADLRQTVLDLANPSLSVTDSSQLLTASLALSQMGQLSKVTVSGVQFKKFDSSVTTFLNSIAKGVKTPGANQLQRSGTQASTDLPPSFANLVALHTDLLSRLYALRVGISNFTNSPLSTVIGLTTVARSKSDIDDLISSITTDGSLAADTDLVTRLITDRAAVKSIGSLPSISDPVISTDRQLPASYVLKGRSDLATASVQTTVGPFALPPLAQATVVVNGTSIGPLKVPQTTFDLNNKSAIASQAVTYPITVPSNFYLFMLVDGTYYKIGPLTAGTPSLSTFLTDLNTQIAASGLSGVLHAVEFIQAGTNRILLYHDSATNIQTVPTYNAASTETVGGSTPAYVYGATYSNSIAPTIGFTETEIGTAGTTPMQFLADAFSVLFGTTTAITVQDANKFTVTSLVESIGTQMTITAPSVLGITGTFFATSNVVTLYGTVAGIPTDPANPIGLLDIGDSLQSTTGTALVTGLSGTQITLGSAIPTFDGSITVTSALTIAYQNLFALVVQFLSGWLGGPFAADLGKLNLAVSSLTSGSPQSQQSAVLTSLDALTAKLQALVTALSDPSTFIQTASASQERSIVDGITATLEERKYDKALDLFERCQIQEALNSDQDTASYGGSFLQAAATFAQTDMVVPNRALDEQVEGTSSQPIKGLGQ